MKAVRRVLTRVVADPAGNTGLARLATNGEIPGGLVNLAQLNRVEGSMAVALSSNGLEVPAVLEVAIRHASLTHLQTSRALDSICARFDELGIPWAVVKGPAVARLWPKGPVTRTYDDLDILVDPCDLREASEALEDLGFVHRNHNWEGFVDLGVAEIPFDDGSVVVDLHWNLVALESDRRHLRLDTSRLLTNTQRGLIAGSLVPVLGDVDAFVHLCCHAGLAGARTLRMLRDVHLFAAQVDPAEAAVALAEAGCERLAAPVLDRAVRCFGPIRSPDRHAWNSAQVCGHRNWTRTNRLVDRAWSSTSCRGHIMPPGAFISAGRPTLVATGWALMGDLSDTVKTRLGLGTVVSEGGRLHWETGKDRDQQSGMDRYWQYVSGECQRGTGDAQVSRATPVN